MTTIIYLGFHLDSDPNSHPHWAIVQKCLFMALVVTLLVSLQGSCQFFFSFFFYWGWGWSMALSLWWRATKGRLHCWRECKKRALKIIFRNCTPALQPLSLQSRREQAAIQLVKEMTQAQHPLHDLLPQTRSDNTNRLLWSGKNITHIQCRTNRLKATCPAYSDQTGQYTTKTKKCWMAQVIKLIHRCMYVYIHIDL